MDLWFVFAIKHIRHCFLLLFNIHTFEFYIIQVGYDELYKSFVGSFAGRVEAHE